MLPDYFAYEKELCIRCLLPVLERARVDLAGKSVLDVGCGYGGVLAGLRERIPLGSALGVDLDARMVRAGRERCPPDVRLEEGDFFRIESGQFDFILMRDVLEHIVDVEGALGRMARLLAPGGVAYLSFAPFYSPFGGHQHNGSGLMSRVPWLQLLPESLFRKVLRLPGNSYKAGEELAADIETVLRTRLTVAGFRAALSRAGLGAFHYRQFLVRPDYRLKFGLPTVPCPSVWGAEELLCTGAEALVRVK